MQKRLKGLEVLCQRRRNLSSLWLRAPKKFVRGCDSVAQVVLHDRIGEISGRFLVCQVNSPLKIVNLRKKMVFRKFTTFKKDLMTISKIFRIILQSSSTGSVTSLDPATTRLVGYVLVQEVTWLMVQEVTLEEALLERERQSESVS